MASSTDNSLLIIAALEQTDPALAASMDARNTWKTTLSETGARVALYRQYEEGTHRSSITDQMRNMLRIALDASGINEFNDNYCEIIVSKMADRLSVTEITLDNTDGDETAADAWLSQLLERNDFTSLQDSFYRNSIIDGETMVQIDPVELKWSIEPVYDGFDGVVALFDGADRINPIWVCKLWSETTAEELSNDTGSSGITMKLIVYQPNKITHWAGKSGTDEIQPSVGEDGVNEKLWSLGKTPFVRFVNKLNDATGFGRSELRAAIPLQDVLNRTIHSMVMASEFSAFSIMWSIGMEIDAAEITPGAVINLTLRDKDGNVVTELSEEAAAFLAACKVGQFAATPMEQYFNQIDRIARELSHITQTPIYGITAAGALSGDALRQLEVGLLGKVQRYQRANTETIKQLIVITAEMQGNFINDVGNVGIPTEIRVNVKWKAAELLDTDAKIATFTKLRKDAPGLFTDEFYRQRIGGLLGMKAGEIKEEDNKAKAEQRKTVGRMTGAAGTVPTMPMSGQQIPQKPVMV